MLGCANGTTFTQIVASAGYTSHLSTGNTVTISLPSGTSAQYVELNFTGNTGWTAAQLSEFEIFPYNAALTGVRLGAMRALSAAPSLAPPALRRRCYDAPGVVLARRYRMISSSWAGAASSRSIPSERSVMTRTFSPLYEEGSLSVMSA